MGNNPFSRRDFLAAVFGSIAAYATRAECAIPPMPDRLLQGQDNSIDFLARQMDQFHMNFPVYTGGGSAGNNFVVLARMTRPCQMDQMVAEAILPPMDMDCTEVDHMGLSCIKAQFNGTSHAVPHSGGWYFMNGCLTAGAVVPKPNWGTEASAGVNLRGAVRLAFRARGQKGGERVNFFCGGIGRDKYGRPAPTTLAGEPIKQPDSSATLTTGYKTLTREWQTFFIDLAGADMSYTLGGFGWVAKADQNPVKNITFYIDNVVYELTPEAERQRLKEPRLLVSYQVMPARNGFDRVLRNVAFVYDNALAILAFLADGTQDSLDRAQMIASALVYAQNHDRTFHHDGRLRTAYMGGSPDPFPRWEGGARTPGWMMILPDSNELEWVEDNYFCGVNTGNMAWACLALLAVHETVVKTGNSPYLESALSMARYIVGNLKNDGPMGGYFAGFETSHDKLVAKGGEHTEPLTYCATEHALDLYAVFCRLAFLTRNQTRTKDEPDWSSEARHAKAFVIKMWDNGGSPRSGAAPWQVAAHKFWTGTNTTANGINICNMPVDIQAWALLSLRGGSKPYTDSLIYAEKYLRVTQTPYFDGYGFKQDSDGVWPEGTAQIAVGLRHFGDPKRADALVDLLQRKVIPDGAAAGGQYSALPLDPTRETIDTGFELFDKRKWLYYRRPHVGATAWFILAKHGINPFWMGSSAPEIE